MCARARDCVPPWWRQLEQSVSGRLRLSPAGSQRGGGGSPRRPDNQRRWAHYPADESESVWMKANGLGWESGADLVFCQILPIPPAKLKADTRGAACSLIVCNKCLCLRCWPVCVCVCVCLWLHLMESSGALGDAFQRLAAG